MAGPDAGIVEIDEIVRDVPRGLDRGLPNYWYPVLQSEDVEAGRPHAFRVMCRDLVAWRDSDGEPKIVADRCPHRNAKLSLGHVFDGDLQCPLHGLRFDGTGGCTRMPWEPDDSDLLDMISVTAFPAGELGGYIWAYLGDAEAFPPPPLEAEVPEELTHGDEFIWFRLPTDYWSTNWLVAIDGGDAFHAAILHAGSQAVSKKEKWTGGAAKNANVPLGERRMKIVQTMHGIRGIALDAAGEPVFHGHLTEGEAKGDRFVLPCLTSNPIWPVPGVEPYTARLWQFPVDETLTRVERYACFRASDERERERATQVFHDVVLPRISKVGAEDKVIAESQGDLLNARSDETLLAPDADTVQLRRKIKDAFVGSLDGRRTGIAGTSLVFPI